MQLVHLYNMLANRNVGILLALRSGGCFLVVFATPNRNLQVWFLLLMIGLGLWFGVVGRFVLVFGLWLELVLWLVLELRLCLLLGLWLGFGVHTWSFFHEAMVFNKPLISTNFRLCFACDFSTNFHQVVLRSGLLLWLVLGLWFLLLMFGMGLWFGVVGRLVLVFGLWSELVLWLVQELRLCLLLGLRFGFGVRTWVGPWVCPLVRPCVGPWATPWAGNLVAAVVDYMCLPSPS